jgi:glucokinase
VLLVDGEVVRLFEGVTGDAGHLLVEHSWERLGERPGESAVLRCALGCRGCLETVASGLAIDRDALEAARGATSPALAAALAASGAVSGRDVSASAANGDVVAKEIIRRAARWLGIGLASWAVVYRPEVVVLGGGVARAGEAWRAAAAESMRERGIPFYVESVEVRLAALGNTAGMVGAALYALRRADAPGD